MKQSRYSVTILVLAVLAIVVISAIDARNETKLRQQATVEERVAGLETRVSRLEGTPLPTATPKPTWTPAVSATPTRVASATATAKPTGTALPSATATPKPTWTTIPTTRPSATPPGPQPEPTEKLPPVLFVMLDWFNGDWGNPDYRWSYVDTSGHRQDYTGHPEYGALGGWTEFHWCDLNPGLGVYNWAKTDQYIKDAQAMRVTLPDGSVIAKPVGIAVVVWTADQDANRIGFNWMPAWVIQEDGGSTMSCKILSGCKSFCSPAWTKTKWQARYDQFIVAMGLHYDNNPEFSNLAWLAVMTGVDGEVVAAKVISGCNYGAGDVPGFSAWCLRAQATYARAFPHIPSFIQPTVHNSNLFAAAATGMAGVKVNGLEPDVASAELRLNDVLVGGVTGFAEAYPGVPSGFEPKRGNGVEGSYWFFMQGLSVHPALFDIQLPNIDQSYLCERVTGFPLLDFVRRHLGVTIADTPDVWIVLRDTVWQDVSYVGSDGVKRTYGPHHGDLSFWLYERTDFPGSHTIMRNADEKWAEIPALAIQHPYGWMTVKRTQVASGNRYFTFDIDDRYVARFGQSWVITATILNMGASPFGLEYRDVTGDLAQQVYTRGPGLGPVGTWVDVTFVLSDMCPDNSLPGDFRLDCMGADLFVHRVIVRGGSSASVGSAERAKADQSVMSRGGW